MSSIERIEKFGHTPELQDALADSIVSGRKRATTSLLRWYGGDGLPYPSIGEIWIVADGQGRPRCTCRTTHVETRPFNEVDAEHAAAEGEDDGSLDRWQATHRQFFVREAAENGFVFDDTSLVVLEQFEVTEAICRATYGA